MVLDELLTAFLGDVDAFARHQGIAEQARLQAAEFAADVVQQVITENRSRSLDALSRVMNALPAVEGLRGEHLERARALDRARLEVEYALDGLELERSIGQLDDMGLEDAQARLRVRLDALTDEASALREVAAQVERALERWYEAGSEQAITV